MREFESHDGSRWKASVRQHEGPDYKGRYHFSVWPAGGSEEEAVPLPEIRWNSEKTARRTLESMSDVELRRRLRSALGRRPAAF